MLLEGVMLMVLPEALLLSPLYLVRKRREQYRAPVLWPVLVVGMLRLAMLLLLLPPAT